MSTKAIEQFLRRPEEGGAYTEGRLAELLAHAEDGKLSYHSCCCVLGVPTADHALEGVMNGATTIDHYQQAMRRYGRAVDRQYATLSTKGNFEEADAERRAKLIPMIHAEFERREAMRNTSTQQPACASPLSDAVESRSQANEKVLI